MTSIEVELLSIIENAPPERRERLLRVLLHEARRMRDATKRTESEVRE